MLIGTYKKLGCRLEQGVSNVFLCIQLLSIALMTYSYVYHGHLRSLRPMIRLIYYAHSE